MKTLFTLTLALLLSAGWASAQQSILQTGAKVTDQPQNDEAALKRELIPSVTNPAVFLTPRLSDKNVIFFEDFSGVEEDAIPAGWMRTHTNWGVSNTNLAGGEAPEMRFNFSPSATDVFRLTTPLIDAGGFSQVAMAFKQHINHYSGTYSLKVQTSPDGAVWTTHWEHIAKSDKTGDQDPEAANRNLPKEEIEEIMVDLSMVDGETFYLSFVFDGYSWNINSWHIDDITVSGIFAPQILVDPENFILSLIPGTSVTRTLTIENAGQPGSLLEASIYCGGVSVLYVNAMGGYDSDFITAMQGLPNVAVFDEFNAHTGTPEPDLLSDYDIVLVSSNYGLHNPVFLGNRLAEYVDAGGRVCLMNTSLHLEYPWGLGGNIILPEYSPLFKAGLSYGWAVTSNIVDHPITNNIDSISTIIYSYTGIQGSGVSLGNYNVAYPFAAYNPHKPVVAINVFPSNGNWGGDLIQLMENTFDWLMGDDVEEHWVSLNLQEASIDAGDSQIVNVNFNAGALAHGIHESAIRIYSNDPGKPLLIVPVTLFADSYIGTEDMEYPGVMIYPSPATTKMHVEFESSGSTTLTLYDLQGRKIEQLRIDAAGTTQCSFNVQHLRAGIYLLSIRNEQNHSIHKVMIKP